MMSVQVPQADSMTYNDLQIRLVNSLQKENEFPITFAGIH